LRYGMSCLPELFGRVMIPWLADPARYLFFTGKGGVGKTSLASATAVSLADEGLRVLLISTDPASNLGQVFGTAVGDEPTASSEVDRLLLLNLDPEAAAAGYRERVIGPMRETASAEQVRALTEQLSGACTVEIAAFDQFTRYLTGAAALPPVDHIVFDTAPTGHTLRLLQLPAAWAAFIADNPAGASCLGPLGGLELQRSAYEAAIAELSDEGKTTLVLVSRAERSSLAEAARASEELMSAGLRNQRVVINGVFTEPPGDDPVAMVLVERQSEALAHLPAALRPYPHATVPLRADDVVGVAQLRALVSYETSDTQMQPADMVELSPMASLESLVEEIAGDGHGLVMIMGKGGVGKTSLATRIAIELARRGHRVHLTTTDPAGQLDQALMPKLEGLEVSRIDPLTARQSYVDQIVASRGRGMSEDQKQLLLEDLRSPCTDEVAIFHAFSRVVREAGRKFVVLDTAPTGHTLLLLDQTGAYHREIIRSAGAGAQRLTTPLMRLQDPSYTKLLVVTLPETTPVLEAAALQADLRRAGIEPYGWIVNQSLSAAQPEHPLLRERAAREVERISDARNHAARIWIEPFRATVPADELVETRGSTPASSSSV
jgi:arsenite/tail-anchored protein-transporting ATPase